MPTITLAGQKGGVGKSTIALCLAVELHQRGRRVLVVDADDQQGTALTWASVAAEQALMALRDVPPVVRMGDNIRTDLVRLAAGYEVTIVDTPGRTGRRAVFALGHSDLALLPCGPTGPEVWAMAGTLEQVRDVQAVHAGLRACILVTRKQVNTVIGRRAARALAETGVDVLETELHLRLAYGEAITAGLGPTTYEPNGEAAREVRALASEVEALVGLASTQKGARRAGKA